MKKNFSIGFLLITAVFAFLAGIIVFQLGLVSFEKGVNKQVETSEEGGESGNYYDYTKNNVADLISVNPENIDLIRRKMIDIIFGTSQLTKQLPDSVFEITDTLYDDVSNLRKIEQFTVVQRYNIQSVGYIFKPEKDNHRLFLYHQGHNGDFIHGKPVIEYFVNKGFTVFAFCMPLTGKNNQPVVTIDKLGTFRLLFKEFESHELMKFLDQPINYFITPVVIMVNYARTQNFRDITMCGISGGGWTTTLAAAVDPRINYSFPVAGTYPMYIKLNTPLKSYGDFEQVYPLLYRNVSYLDMYILGATGKNRSQTQILNLHDPCCFDKSYYKHYEPIVKDVVNEFKAGSFDVISDTENKEHRISEFSMDMIWKKLNHGKD